MILIEVLAALVTRGRWLAGGLMLLATILAAWGATYDPSPGAPERAESRDDSRAERTNGETDDGTDDESTDTANARSPEQSSSDNSQRPRVQVAADEFDRRAADAILVVELENLFTPEGVSAVRDVVAAVEAFPAVESIMWVDTVPTLNVFGLREPLLPPADASAKRFESARNRALRNPLVIGQLLSPDGRTLMMPIVFDWMQVTSDADCSRDLLSAARDAAARWDQVPMRIRLTGNVPLFLAHDEAFDRNHLRFQVIAYVLVFVLALILFRGFRAVLICALAPALGVFWTVGLLQYLGELSNPLTNVVLPVLLTMVGLTDGVHLMIHIRKRRADGATPHEAAASAVRQVGLACFLTSLTTAIGFASLLVAQSPFVRGFGRGCAIGVAVTFFAVVLFIPVASLTPLGRHIEKGHEHDLVGRGLRRFGWLIDGVIHHARWISAVAVLVTIGLAVIAARLRPDDRTADSQPTGSEAYQALQHCDRAMGGIEFVRIVIDWPETMAADAPELLAAVREVEKLVDDEPTMQHPLSILSILASLPGDQPPVERGSFLQLLPRSVINAYLNPDTRRALVTVRIQDLGIARYEPIFRRVEAGLAKLAEERPGFRFELTGDPVRRGRNLYQIVVDLAASLGTASLVIFVVMAMAYRSLRIGLICVVPNLFPLVVTAAMMVLLGHPLEIASVCSFTVCLGIAVDDTIHFLTRYQTELPRDGDVAASIRRTFMSVGSAMVITTLILVTGFGTVLTSDLPGHRYFAAMAVSTITSALVGDLIFLPALLVALKRRRSSAIGRDVPLSADGDLPR